MESPKNKTEHAEQYDPLFQDKKKRIECKHEIIFNITARVMEEDETGQDISCREILTRNYHIPVKEKTDYQEFLHIFLSFFEKCLASSAKEAYEKTPETTETQKKE